MLRGMAGGITSTLKNARNALRDYLEDRLPHMRLPRWTRDDVYARYGIEHPLWDRYERDFKDDVGLATRADADLLFPLMERLRPRRFLEIGTWRGGTAALVKTISPQTEVVTINYPDSETVNNPLKKAEIGQAFFSRKLDVRLVWADSAELPKLDLGTFDAIYVDGDHRYAAVLRDLTNTWSILEHGGTLMFHDYVDSRGPDRPPHTRRVVRAFRRFARDHAHEFADAFCMEGSWIGVVRKV